ncbi:MAG: T9SS type A sorting domain-containing protein [Bacteroidetes bacterium]|nr:T9SS type A sorting domain-containing protein [Bacteroidota bacterium]
MKKLFLVLITFVLSMNVHASHIAGQTITLQYTGTPNTYIIKSQIYRDCAGVPGPNSIVITFNDGPFPQATTYNVALNLVSQQVLPSFTCAPTTPLLCINGYGLEVFDYIGTVVLPYASSDWHFWYTNCCRNVSTTLVSNGDFVCEAILDNLNFPTNSLPEFTPINTPYFCINQPAVFPNYAIDVDGDSIVYSLIPARESSGSGFVNCAYNSPFTETNFISSSTPHFFDTFTGIASFTPNLNQTGVMVVLASEYRNGVFIGSTMRDIVVQTTNGIYTPNQITGNVFIDLNNDSIKNGLDYGIKNLFVQSTPLYSYHISNVNGDYSMYIANGPHSVNMSPLPSWFSVSPANYNFNFTVAGSTASGNDFAVYPIPGTTELELSMSINPVRPQVRTSLLLNVKNLGSDFAAGNLVLTLPDSVNFDSASVTPNSIIGNLVSWSLPTINLLQSFSVMVWVVADSGLVIGDSVYFEASVTASPGTDINPSNNLAAGWVDVINSFDPNIKTVFPSGTVPQSSILSGQPLTYQIEFENTGNANALTVRLTDILPMEVKLSSIEILSASHSYTTQIIYPRQLEFTFSGINLPPTSVDPIHSKGYIIFKVTPENYLNVGTVIANEANIYFDNNPPVITPMAEVVVVGTTGIAESNNTASNSLFIYPNPTQDRVNIEMQGAESGKYAVSLYSVDGKLINALSIQKQKEQPLQLDLSNTDKGIYIIIVSKDNSVWSSKVVRN